VRHRSGRPLATANRQLNREGIEVARCTVGRLMAETGPAGADRGEPLTTPRPDPAAPGPRDRVTRQVHAPGPNAPWVPDVTDVATRAGGVHVAVVIDAFARRIVGGRAARSMQAELALDALEQALHDRRPAEDAGLVHRSDRGARHLSIRCTERLGEAGIAPSVGARHRA
jgi:transposase InsO family protein